MGQMVSLRGDMLLIRTLKSCSGVAPSHPSPSVLTPPPHDTLQLHTSSRNVTTPSPFRDEVLDAVRQQKELFERATGSRRRAQESQKLLAVLFYTALPPGRAKEFQTLHVATHDTLPRPVVDQERPNRLHINTNGTQAYLLLADYKTHKCYGDHFVPLHEDTPLLRHIAVHLNYHRKFLLGTEQQSIFLFLVSMHAPLPPPPPSQYNNSLIRSLVCSYVFHSPSFLPCPLPIPPFFKNERGAPYSASVRNVL